MTIFRSFAAISGLVALSGCITPQEDPNAALTAAFSGTTFTNEGGTVVIAKITGGQTLTPSDILSERPN